MWLLIHNTLTLIFPLAASATLVTEVLWHVNTIKTCAWQDHGIPETAPPAPPAPSPATSLLVQNYDSQNCDPNSVENTGSNAWLTLPIDSCNAMGDTGQFFSLGCHGIHVTVKANCTDAACTKCQGVFPAVLGNCNAEAPTNKSFRVLYLGDSVCP